MQHDPESFLSVNLAKEGVKGYERIYKRSPLVSSLSVDWSWKDLAVAYDSYPPGETPTVSLQQHCIAIYTDMPSSFQVERTIDGRSLQEKNIQGGFIFLPANTSHKVVWNEEGGMIAIAIEPTAFAQSIHEVVDPDSIEVLPRFTTHDPLIYHIGVALKSTLFKYGTSSCLYAESLINTLTLHLLEHYSTSSPSLSGCTPGKLPRYKLQQTIDYIYAYLDRDLSLKDLSNVVQMSPNYFAQLFKQTTGITPHQYVIRCRIERAKELMQLGKIPLAEIAIQVGFVDQSHLNRHFKRLVGVTPKTYFRESH